MAVKPTRKKILKTIGIFISILIVLLIGFHFWFKAHAKQMLEDLVENKSNGKLKMTVGKFRFGYWSKNMELDNVVFLNTDTSNNNTAYHFSVKQLKMRGKGILNILFDNHFMIDSITLHKPDIKVTRLKLAEKDDNINKKDVSIPEEMGKVYKSIQDALSVLKVTKFRIEDGQFTLINKVQENRQPLIISRINFEIDNFIVNSGSSKNKEKILFSDNVILLSSNQDIVLPDGRHHISFKSFRINLKKQLVEFDSCTIAATRTDENKSSFNIFFDRLSLTKIDFDTLYKAEVIKADSVYCINPRFDLKVEIVKKKESNKVPPRLEDIIKQLTGDLLLAHVIVSNADINIETTKDGIPSSFTFSKNNFEMEGFKIDQSAAKPLKVDRFAMSIRNYENFLKDSTYNIKFDSILFKDDRISLSNFLLETLSNGKRVNSFRIPQFYLRGLSWDDLVFEKKLKADEATMFNPTILYTANPAKRKPGQQNIFQSLGTVNEFMDLKHLKVVDGNIDLTIKKDLRLKLFKANLSIESNSLLSSKKLSNIKNSLQSLNFENGKLQAGTLEIEINGLKYISYNNHFAIENIALQDKNKQFNFLIKDVEVDNMIVDELTGNINAENISWKKGNAEITLHKKNTDKNQSLVLLKNLKGENTTVTIFKDDMKITSAISTINLTKLESIPGLPISIEGLKTSGSNLKVKDNTTDLSIADYKLTDTKISFFNSVNFKSKTKSTNINFSAESCSLIPTLKSLLKKDFILEDLEFTKPVLSILVSPQTKVAKAVYPNIQINSVKTHQPQINIAIADSSSTSIKWNGTLHPLASLEIKNIDINSNNTGDTKIDFVNLNMSDFEYSANGKTFFSNKGNIAATLKNISFNSTMHTVKWQSHITDLKTKDFHIDSVGKNNGNFIIKTADVKNVTVNSTIAADIKKIMAANDQFQLLQFTGNYTDSLIKFNWKNVSFNRNNNYLSLNYFSYTPGLQKDSFIAQQDFQKDYITFKTGVVEVSQFDPLLFLNEKLLKATTIKINDAEFTDFKDKQIPFNPGLIKPLPVTLLKKIPFQIAIENTDINNGKVIYTETVSSTNAIGIIPVSNMNIKIRNIKNLNFLPSDTLYMDVTAFLLDTAWAHLNIKESYNDANGGFLMEFQLAPTDLSVINAVLIPLASVKLTSGFLDTLSATVTGTEAVARGEMKMLYHDLKIKFLKDGVEPQKGLFRNFKSFLANTLVIKKDNTHRTGQIFFVRSRDRSAINYYVKIIGSGVASSIGAKNNKKAGKKYQKSLQKNN